MIRSRQSWTADAVFLVLTLSASGLQAADFPDYTKISGLVENSHLPTKPPEVLWKVISEQADANGRVTMHAVTDPVVAGGVLYFGDNPGNLMAVSVKDQTELWNHKHGSRIASTPSVDREFVFFTLTKGVTALRRETGDVAWTHPVEHGASESTPIPVGENVFVSGYDGKSYCLNRTTGKVVWQHDFVEDAPADQPEFAGARARFQNIAARPCGSACDGKLFIQCVFDQSRVIALDCATGQRRWAFQTGGWMRPAPTIAGDRVYVASQDKHLYCLDRANGKLIWKYQTPSWLASRVAVHDGKVYLPHHSARLYQLDAESGKLLRTMEPPDEADRRGAVYSFPIIANQTAYFACGSTGQLLAFDIETGEMRWNLCPSENSELFTDPATDGQRIYVTSRPSKKDRGENAIFAIGLQP